MQKIHFVLLLLFCSLLFLPEINALGLSGKKLGTIIYEPGKTIINSYEITDTDKEVNVSIGGDLAKYVTLSGLVGNQFKMQINFPDKLIEPGTYWISVVATEKGTKNEGSSSAIGSLISVTKQIKIEVYSEQKDIVVSFNAPSVNEGNPIDFGLGVESRSYKQIDKVYAEIKVYNGQNQELAKLKTATKKLPALSSESFTVPFDASKLAAGNYWAEAVVFYDGQSKRVNDTFKIGNFDILILNYTSELEQGYAEFRVNIQSNWGNELKNVYAKLFIEGKEMLQTPSIDLAPWQKQELKGILKLDLEPGLYKGKLQLFFENELKETDIFITVVLLKITVSAEPKVESQPWISFGILISIALVIILLFFLFNKKKKKKKDDL